jgi:hypothetical protein
MTEPLSASPGQLTRCGYRPARPRRHNQLSTEETGLELKIDERLLDDWHCREPQCEHYSEPPHASARVHLGDGDNLRRALPPSA